MKKRRGTREDSDSKPCSIDLLFLSTSAICPRGSRILFDLLHLPHTDVILAQWETSNQTLTLVQLLLVLQVPPSQLPHWEEMVDLESVDYRGEYLL